MCILNRKLLPKYDEFYCYLVMYEWLNTSYIVLYMCMYDSIQFLFKTELIEPTQNALVCFSFISNSQLNQIEMYFYSLAIHMTFSIKTAPRTLLIMVVWTYLLLFIHIVFFALIWFIFIFASVIIVTLRDQFSFPKSEEKRWKLF